jgi:hypothetical protein
MPNLEKARTAYNKALEHCSDAYYAAYGGAAAWVGKAVLSALHIPYAIKQSEAEKLAEEKKIPDALTSPLSENKVALGKKIVALKAQIEASLVDATIIKSSKKKDLLAALGEAKKKIIEAETELPK